MARGIFGGMTDYSHQSFTDIVQDLENEQKNVTAFLKKIKENLNSVIDNGFWNEKVISNFQIIVAYSIKHYETTEQELTEIANDIQNEVKEHHCKRLNKIATVAQEINVDIGKIWHRDYEEYGVKDYDDQNFRIVENIYADTRDMAVNLLDLSNIAGRLKDFIGKQNHSGVANKKKFKLELSHKLTILGLILTTIIILFGNNILERLTGKDSHKIKNDTTSAIEEKHDTILATLKLPYLENVPIIDKGLFVKYYYNNFIIGGVNIDTISISARTKTGERISVNVSYKDIEMDITQEPYIEFEYKGAYYSIEISGGHLSSINCVIRKNIKPTLKLKNYNDINGLKQELSISKKKNKIDKSESNSINQRNVSGDNIAGDKIINNNK